MITDRRLVWKIIAFGIVELHIKSNQCAKSTPHRFNVRSPSQITILFQTRESSERSKVAGFKKSKF